MIERFREVSNARCRDNTGRQARAALALYAGGSTVLSTNGEPVEVHGLAATSDIFSVLKISPILGRAWTRAEDDPATRVVRPTYEAWQR